MGKKKKMRKKAGEASTAIAQQYGVNLPEPQTDKFLSPNEIGKILNLTGEAVKQWIYQRRLPAVKLSNGYWKVKASDLETFLKDRQNFAKRQILLIGDALIAKIIADESYDIVSTENHSDAMLKAVNSVPAMIVVDMHQKSVDSFKFLEKITETKQMRKIPIIFLGEKLSDDDTDKAVKLGVKALIDPKNVANLKAEIARNF